MSLPTRCRLAAILLAGIASLLNATATPTASEIVPSAGPRGARVIILGTGLNQPDVTVKFGTSVAMVVVRSSTLLEVVVPAAAISGNVLVENSAGAIGSLPFTVSADPSYVRVSTLAASAKAHDIFKDPAGVAVALSTGLVYVADRLHHQIRTISPDKRVDTLAGSGKPGLTDGAGTQAEFKEPSGVAFDAARKALYVVDSGNHVVRRLTVDGGVTTFAGSGRPDDADGVGTLASFKQPRGIAIDAAGNLYIADTGNNKIKMVSPAAVVRTMAGGNQEGFADGEAAFALFKQPQGIAVGADGAVYIADTRNHAIRKLQDGKVTTVAGTGHGGLIDGLPNVAEFKEPSGIAVDEAGNAFVADAKNHAIRKIGPTGVFTLAGNGKPGSVDGESSIALFKEPNGIAAAGALFVADSQNDAVRMLVPGLTASDLYPRSGDPSGGTSVRLFGSGFVPGMMQVTFGSSPVSELTYISSTELVVTTPRAPIGNVDVTINSPAGAVTLKEAFRYEPPFVTIVVNPAGATIDPGRDLQFSAQGVATDQSLTDITNRVDWSSSAPGVATISSLGSAHGFVPGSTVITATLGTLSRAVNLIVRSPEPLPPDPSTTAPRLDATIVGTFNDETRFLYSGPNAIQTGVSPGAIIDGRAAVIRGTIRTVTNTPLAGAHVTILGHPEFGQTLSRADGVFDFAMNGGGTVTLKIERSSYIPAQRSVTLRWNQQLTIPDTILTTFDSQVTTIVSGASDMQVARGSVASDAGGSRRATVLVPSGTMAVLALPDGSTQPAPLLHVRATEFTIGPNGPRAMPATLPATSAYTYCVELSADEATAAGAVTVRFSKPLPFYVENFLNFPTGIVVPVGTYDRESGAWITSDNGIVLKIVGITNGTADVDTDGDGVADDAATLASFGIDTAELQTLATLYSSGQSLWRVPLSHFTPIDCNWPYIPPADAVAPSQPSPVAPPSAPSQHEPCDGRAAGSSIVNCYTQTLTESIPISGTPFRLEYDSSRAGRPPYKATIHLSGPALPSSLLRIELTIGIAGRSWQLNFPPQPNLAYDFSWDGTDVYGRPVQGAREAAVTVAYAYPAVYAASRDVRVAAWARISNIPISASRARDDIKFLQAFSVPLGHFSVEHSGFGGWSLNAQRLYDGRGRTIYDSAGAQRSGDPDQSKQLAVTTVAGNIQCCFGGDGGPATEAKLSFPQEIAVGPDGTLYISDSYSSAYTRIRKVDPVTGVIKTIVGTGIADFTPDGAPAMGNPIAAFDIAIGPDGSLYINDQRNFRVRRVVDGLMTTVAGSGVLDGNNVAVNGTKATQTAIDPQAIAVGADGSVYIGERYRISRIGMDGVFTTWYGGRGSGNEIYVLGLAVGLDGSVYATDGLVVHRITASGVHSIIAGTQSNSARVQDGQPATSGSLSTPWGIAVASDGTVLVAEVDGTVRIRAIAPNGVITTLIGTGAIPRYQRPQEGVLGRSAAASPFDVKIGPDGSVYYADWALNVIRRAENVFPPLRRGATIIPSADGGEAYVFDNERHATTVDTLTGTTLLTLAYDANGFATSLADADGNVTSVERDGSGNPTAIVAPGGQRTALTVVSGKLTSLRNPADATYDFAYNGSGLLSQLRDPRGGIHRYTYDQDGLLARDEGPDGSFIGLLRSGNGQSYTISRSSAEGRTQSYRAQLAGDTSAQRERVAPDGTRSLSVFFGAVKKTTLPDGTAITTSDAPDPRFGMQSPLSNVTWSGGGHTLTLNRSRSVSLADPANPLTLTSITDTVSINGSRWTSTYDVSTGQSVSTSPLGRSQTRRLDARGRLTSVGEAGIEPMMFTYDAFGRVSAMQQGTRNIGFAYDNRHQLISLTDSLQRTVRFDYDPAGRVTSQTLPDGRVIEFSYDPSGNLISVTPPGRPRHVFAYTPADLTSTYTPPAAVGSDATRYSYDLDRQLTLIQRPDGRSIAINYDVAGRLGSVALARGSFAYSYNAAGQLQSISAPDGEQMTYAYSGPLLMRVAWQGAVAGAVSLDYDNVLRLAGETVGGSAIAYGYDSDGLLLTAGAMTLKRDPQNGLLIGSTLGSINDSWAYDSFGDVVSYSARANDSPLFSQQLTRDDAGRIRRKSETVAGETHVDSYDYDAAGRVSTVFHDGVNVASYTYDSNSNRLSNQSGVYDDQDRLLSYGAMTFTYTGNGETASKTDNSGTTSYSYDELGNLMKVILPNFRVIEYIVDGENRRVGKKIEGLLVRQWLYSDARIVAELDGVGNLVSRFVYGTRTNTPDSMIQDGIAYKIVTDHLGSPRLVVNASTGSVAQQMDYDEFGNVLSNSNPGFQPFGFAGGLFDSETDLVRFGVRDYDAQTGRWTAKDPFDFAGGDPNLYGYVLNDPVNVVDPSGLEIKRCFRPFASPRLLLFSEVVLVNFPMYLLIQPPVPGARNFLGHEYLYNTDTGKSQSFDPSEDQQESGNGVCYTIPEPIGQCVWRNFRTVAGPRENYKFLTNNCQITINKTVSACRQTLFNTPPGAQSPNPK